MGENDDNDEILFRPIFKPVVMDGYHPAENLEGYYIYNVDEQIERTKQLLENTAQRKTHRQRVERHILKARAGVSMSLANELIDANSEQSAEKSFGNMIDQVLDSSASWTGGSNYRSLLDHEFIKQLEVEYCERFEKKTDRSSWPEVGRKWIEALKDTNDPQDPTNDKNATPFPFLHLHRTLDDKGIVKELEKYLAYLQEEKNQVGKSA